MGNKLRHEGDEVRIKVIWPDLYRDPLFLVNGMVNGMVTMAARVNPRLTSNPQKCHGALQLGTSPENWTSKNPLEISGASQYPNMGIGICHDMLMMFMTLMGQTLQHRFFFGC